MNAYQMFGLRRLSQLLRELPPEKFNMKHWSSNMNGDPTNLHACGTAGCIAGWSTLFFDSLHISRTSDIATNTELICSVGLVETMEGENDHDSDCEESGYKAAALAWGVSKTEAEAICSSTRVYDSPSDAADVIDALIEKYFIQEPAQP